MMDWRRGNHGCGKNGICLCCAGVDKVALREKIKEKWPERLELAAEMYPEFSILSVFNDHPATTIEEIESLLEGSNGRD